LLSGTASPMRLESGLVHAGASGPRRGGEGAHPVGRRYVLIAECPRSLGTVRRARSLAIPRRSWSSRQISSRLIPSRSAMAPRISSSASIRLLPPLMRLSRDGTRSVQLPPCAETSARKLFITTPGSCQAKRGMQQDRSAEAYDRFSDRHGSGAKIHVPRPSMMWFCLWSIPCGGCETIKPTHGTAPRKGRIPSCDDRIACGVEVDRRVGPIGILEEEGQCHEIVPTVHRHIDLTTEERARRIEVADQR
jgi:hypothetical protein